MLRFISAVALVALFVFGVNWWFTPSNGVSRGGWLSSLVSPEAANFSSSIPNGLANIKDVFGGAVSSSLNKTRQNIADALDNARGTVNDTFTTQTGRVFDFVEENLGVASRSLNKNIEVANNLQVTVSVKVLEQANFSIKNINKQDSSYKIDWGDGSQSTGVLRGEEEAIASHAFQWPGSYRVVMPGQEFLVRVTY